MLSSLETALTQRLQATLPGVEAQLRMAPDYRLDRELASVVDKRCREAAVLALLHDDAARGPEVLLIQRPTTLRKHAGQIAFPGGRREAVESLTRTALRETEEEVGIRPSEIRLLGAMTPLYVPPSGYCVYPFVGTTPFRPELTLQPEEVAEAFWIPLSELADTDNHTSESRLVRGLKVDVPAYETRNRFIWGATAMMLSELLAVYETVAG